MSNATNIKQIILLPIMLQQKKDYIKYDVVSKQYKML